MPLLHTASAALSILSCISGDGVFLSLVGYGTASMGNFASVINGTIVWSAQIGVVSSSRFRFALRLLDVFARVPLGFFGLGDARTRFEVALFELGDAGVRLARARFEVALFELGDAGVRLARARFEVALFELGDAGVRLGFFGLGDARARFEVALFELGDARVRLGFFGLGDARARFEVALFELGDARVRLDFFGLVDARARDVAMIALSISSIARLDIGRQPN